MNLRDQKIITDLQNLSGRQAEDLLYNLVMAEISEDDLDPVAWAMAFEEAEGEEQRSKALYLKHRIRRIKDDILAVELDKKVQLLPESKVDLLNQKIKEEKSATSNFTRVGLFICVGCIVILYLGLVEPYGVLFTIIIAVLIVTLVITALKNFVSEAKIDGIERERKKLEDPKFHRFTKVVGNIILAILVFGFLVWLIDAQ
jgi:hypothetical protein